MKLSGKFEPSCDHADFTLLSPNFNAGLMASITSLTYRGNKRSSFVFRRVQNLPNFDYNLSHIGESLLQSFLVQIS